MSSLDRTISFFIVGGIGAGFLFATKFPFWFPHHAEISLVMLFCFLLFMTAGTSLWLAREKNSSLPSLHFAVTPLLLVGSAWGFFLLIESTRSRLTLVISLVSLLFFYFSFLRKENRIIEHFTDNDLLHFSFVLHALSAFFCFAFLFGMMSFTQISLPICAVIIAIFIAVVVEETLWRIEKNVKKHALIILAFSVLAAEGFIALSFLPTLYLVDAVVAVILFAYALHAVMHVLLGHAHQFSLRRQFTLSISLVTLVFFTAQWK